MLKPLFFFHTSSNESYVADSIERVMCPDMPERPVPPSHRTMSSWPFKQLGTPTGHQPGPPPAVLPSAPPPEPEPVAGGGGTAAGATAAGATAAGATAPVPNGGPVREWAVKEIVSEIFASRGHPGLVVVLWEDPTDGLGDWETNPTNEGDAATIQDLRTTDQYKLFALKRARTSEATRFRKCREGKRERLDQEDM